MNILRFPLTKGCKIYTKSMYKTVSFNKEIEIVKYE